MSHKRIHKKRKNKKQTSITINASNVSNSSINIASDSSVINEPKEQSPKWERFLQIAAAFTCVTGITIYSIFDNLTNSESVTIDTTETKYIKPTSTTVERSSHTIERVKEYSKDCTVVTIHKGDTIIKHMNQKQESPDSISKL